MQSQKNTSAETGPIRNRSESGSLVEPLAKYASYHKDHRNIATHFVGIPMIVVGVLALLSRPGITLFDVFVSPAAVVALAAMLYYLTLDLRFGAVMALFLGICLLIGGWFAEQSRLVWLTGSLGLLGVGWAFQFVGHYYEGRKPAFMDDLKSLLIGPLFVVAEAAFALGFRDDVRRAVEADGARLTGHESPAPK